MISFPFDPLGLVDKARAEAVSERVTDDRSAVVSKYERTDLDEQAEAACRAWWTEHDQ